MAKNRKTPDMNLPMWFDGQNINEALFCEEFLQESRIIFANRAFFTPNGRVTDDIVLRGEVYEKLKSYTISSVPQKIKNIMEVLKLEAMVEDLPPQPDRIHVVQRYAHAGWKIYRGEKGNRTEPLACFLQSKRCCTCSVAELFGRFAL